MFILNLFKMKRKSLISSSCLQHYVLIRKWGSDMEFFKIETSFLHRLLDEYFVRLTNSLFIQDLKSNGQKLLNLEKEVSKVDLLIKRQLKELEWIAKNLISENKERVIDAQVELEFHMKSVALEFREVKTNIFKLIERVIHEDSFVIK